jgi:disulfide bond formation protein DsbB
VYLTDATLSRVIAHTIVDPGFSVDLARFGGSAWVDPHTVLALSENKSYVILKENSQADAAKNFRFFLESFDQFDEVARSRVTTVRARMMYALSVAFDSDSGSFLTITVPNAKVKRMVVSRFDRRDMTLSEEFVPSLDAASGFSLVAKERSIDEYYITGAAFSGGRLYALSAAFNTLVAIDPASKRIVSAVALPGLVQPAGLAFKGSEIYVAGRDGTITVFEDRDRAPGIGDR